MGAKSIQHCQSLVLKKDGWWGLPIPMHSGSTDNTPNAYGNFVQVFINVFCIVIGLSTC